MAGVRGRRDSRLCRRRRVDPDYVSPTYVTVLPCSPTVVATGGVSYYGCGGSWYNQAYVNGSVTYVTVSAPPGY